MGIIISDKDKLIQDLGKKMTKVTDIYSTTHKVVHWGDVQAIVEKFFMDKNSDWLMAKTEPSNSEKPNNCDTCRFELYCPEMCEGCCEWDSHYEPKDEPTISKMEQVEDEFKQFDREDLILLIECQKERIAELLAKDEPQIEEPTEITYQNCSDALLKMWMDNVLTDAEYNRIMDKLNNVQRKDEPQTDVYDYKGNGKWERSSE